MKESLKRKYIKKLFTDPESAMNIGFFFSGVWGIGEYKRWHKNGKLSVDTFFDEDQQQHGSAKTYDGTGKLWSHSYFNHGNEIEKLVIKGHKVK